MSTTLIQIKRSTTAGRMAQGGRILAAGEPAVDFEANKFYIGNGIANPGLEFAAIDSEASEHFIATTSGIQLPHKISNTKIGQVLRATGEQTARMQRLGFYDLGHATDIDPEDGTSTIVDGTGMQSRWHWMSTHVALRRSIFFTGTSVTGVGAGPSGTGGVGNMAHSGIANGDDIIGCRVESLSYAAADLENESGEVMALVARNTGSDNVLEFRRLLATDIDGQGSVASHAMTGASHTGTINSLFYTKGTTSVLSLPWSSATVGHVLKKVSGPDLAFGTLDIENLGGNFKFPASTAASRGLVSAENYTFRYNASTVRWEAVDSVRSLRNTTFSGIVAGDTVNSNLESVAGTSPCFLLRTYEDADDVNTGLDIIIPKGLTLGGEADDNPKTHRRVVFATAKTTGGNNDIMFYTATSRKSNNDAPNLWLREDGALWVRPISLSAPLNTTLADPTDVPNIRAFYIYSRNITRNEESDPTKYPGYNSIEIDEFTHTQNIPATANTAGISGIRIKNMTTSGSTVDSHHEAAFIRCDTINTRKGSHGVRIAGVTGASYATGFEVYSVNSTLSNSISKGIYFFEVKAAAGKAYGFKAETITSLNESIALSIGSVVSSSGAATGLYFSSIDSGTTSSLLASDYMRADGFATGVSMLTIRGTTKTVGLFINTGSDTANLLNESLIANGSHYGVYSIGKNKFVGTFDVVGNSVFVGTFNLTGNITTTGTSVFGGATTVTGNFTVNGATVEINTTGTITFDGNTVIDTGHTFIVNGSIGADQALLLLHGSARIADGSLDIPYGIVKERLTEINANSIIFRPYTDSTELIPNDSIRQNTRHIIIKPSGGSNPWLNYNEFGYGIHRIGRGYHGQVITISMGWINQPVTHIAIFDKRFEPDILGDGPTPNADITFRGGDGIPDSGRYWKLRNNMSFSFICIHDDTEYVWVMLSNQNVEDFDS